MSHASHSFSRFVEYPVSRCLFTPSRVRCLNTTRTNPTRVEVDWIRTLTLGSVVLVTYAMPTQRTRIFELDCLADFRGILSDWCEIFGTYRGADGKPAVKIEIVDVPRVKIFASRRVALHRDAISRSVFNRCSSSNCAPTDADARPTNVFYTARKLACCRFL